MSSHPISKDQQEILELGLSFCPTSRIDKTELCHDIHAFTRRVRLTEWASDEGSDEDFPSKYAKPTSLKNKWTPPDGRNQFIDSFVSTVQSHLDNFLSSLQNDSTASDTQHNLSKSSRKAIRDLRNRDDIIIRRADKGGAVVVLDTTCYISEAETQLSNEMFYKEVEEDPTSAFKCELGNLINTFNLEIRQEVEELIPCNPKPGLFYTLPKIHKLPKLVAEKCNLNSNSISEPELVRMASLHNIQVPGRPIISGVGTLTEFISAFVDSYLQPLLRNIPSYIQDTTDFLCKLNSYSRNLCNDAILVTMDVTALYTNIPHAEGTAACKAALERSGCDYTSEICSLIQFILTHNNFNFNERNYIQTNGTAMGTRMAPSYANLFMAEFERNLLHLSNRKPAFYVRFIDDIFIIWEEGIDELRSFFQLANSLHPTIKFTMESSCNKIPFLDVEISLKNGVISTKVFTKPTDRHCYLHFNSFHPAHIKRSIVFSQLLRYKRICSDNATFVLESTKLIHHFLLRGYPFRLLDATFHRVNSLNRDQLLKYKDKSTLKRIPLVIKHHPDLDPLLQNIQSSWNILQSDPTIKPFFPLPPTIARKQPRNLRSIVCRSKPHLNAPKGNLPCNKPRCQLCGLINTSPSYTDPTSGITLSPGLFNCDSANVVYYLYCAKCPGGAYVGETSDRFRLRFNNHKHSIRHNKTGFPVAAHFNTPNHSISDLRFFILAGNFPSVDKRKQFELNTILKLRSHKTGLNRDLSILSNYSWVQQV